MQFPRARDEPDRERGLGATKCSGAAVFFFLSCVRDGTPGRFSAGLRPPPRGAVTTTLQFIHNSFFPRRTAFVT